MHNENTFITLTYDEENLPYDGSLQKSHFQKFMKRLRKQYAPQKIRYFMCGEYGSELSRPHYHALLFGIDFHDKELWSDRDGLKTYRSRDLERVWQGGLSTVGPVNFATAAYCSRYVTKKVTGEAAEDHYTRIIPETGEVVHLVPEYISMSLKPAIGKTWYGAYKSDCYPSDFITHEGKKQRVPKYYDKLLEESDPELLASLKSERKLNAVKWFDEQTKSRREQKEQCAIARMAQNPRRYEQ